MKKILITGASGFVGSFIVEAALAKGFETYAGIRSISSKEFLKDGRVNFLSLDFTDKNALLRLFQQHRFDIVIHCAGITKADRKADYLKVNFEFTRQLVETMKEAAAIPDTFVFISSLAAYGPADGQPGDVISESDTPRPITAYGESKLAAERYLQSIPDLPFIIIRPTAVYGPRERDIFSFFQLIKFGIEPYIGFRKQELTFIYIKDLARAVLEVAENPNCIRKAYFITDGQAYSADELGWHVKQALNMKSIKFRLPLSLVRMVAQCTEQLAKLSGKNAAFNLEKVKELGSLNWKCDIRPLQNDIGFEPKYLLANGMKETIEWYIKNKWL